MVTGVVAAVYALVLSALAAAAPPAGIETDVARGIAQVKAGDHTRAIATLEDAIRRLSAEPARMPLLVEAYLHLAVAHQATGDAEGALAELGAALDLDPDLRVKGGEMPAEMRARLDELREQRSRSAAPARAARRRSALRKTAALVGGGAALAGGGVVLYKATQDLAILEVRATRFETPVVVCPDGAEIPVPFALLIDVLARERLEVTGVEVKSIYASGQVSASIRGIATISPSRLAPDTTTTVRIEGLLACNNNRGNAAMSGQMRFGGQIETSLGRFRFETPTGTVMRYEVP